MTTIEILPRQQEWIMNDYIWVINTTDKPMEECITEIKQWIVFKPKRPVQLERDIALRLCRSLDGLRICDNPDKYFIDIKENVCIIRDNGIGDLLLLEPVIRAFKNKGCSSLTVATLTPDVYFNHPSIDNILRLRLKESMEKITYANFERIEDLRNYSETDSNRDKQHRTLIYNQRFRMNITDDDLEPRLYFHEGEKNTLFEREPASTYIGIQCDASHSYRRFDKGSQLVQAVLDAGCVPVIFGAWDFIKHNNDPRTIDLQGKTSVRQMINAVRDCDYLIAVDSGIMHVALTMHVPTVCIFSIITPDFRLRYYRGKYEVIANPDIRCIGCGNWHMIKCKYGEKVNNEKFIPPCLDLDTKMLVQKALSMAKNGTRRIFTAEKKDFGVGETKKDMKKHNGLLKVVNINVIEKKKLIMPIIVLNEEANLPRWLDLVGSNENIKKIIAIDGGSTDRTVELLQKAGAQVYVHPYDSSYHDMQAMQRNYSCSFIPDGEKILIMDIDECFSKELKAHLPYLCEVSIDYGQISRRTFKYFKDINDPNLQIKNYPDYQPRFFTWHRRMKWVGSPHHNIYNAPQPVKIDKDIIHFECEGKDRDGLERKWAEMQNRTKEVYK